MSDQRISPVARGSQAKALFADSAAPLAASLSGRLCVLDGTKTA